MPVGVGKLDRDLVQLFPVGPVERRSVQRQLVDGLEGDAGSPATGPGGLRVISLVGGCAQQGGRGHCGVALEGDLDRELRRVRPMPSLSLGLNCTPKVAPKAMPVRLFLVLADARALDVHHAVVEVDRGAEGELVADLVGHDRGDGDHADEAFPGVDLAARRGSSAARRPSWRRCPKARRWRCR